VENIIDIIEATANGRGKNGNYFSIHVVIKSGETVYYSKTYKNMTEKDLERVRDYAKKTTKYNKRNPEEAKGLIEIVNEIDNITKK